MSSRIKKIYQLRKASANNGTVKLTSTLQGAETLNEIIKDDQVDFNEAEQTVSANISLVSAMNGKGTQHQQDNQLDEFLVPPATHLMSASDTVDQLRGPELQIDKSYIVFDQQINKVTMQTVKVRNVGSYAVYYEWVLKNEPKINLNAVKDSKPKFYCHHKANVIKPKQQITFVFSFYSEIPGSFTEECELVCRPTLITPLSRIILEGKAKVQDKLSQDRSQFLSKLNFNSNQQDVKEIVADVFTYLKLPQPPKPDVSNPAVAEKQFEAQNAHLILYYQPGIHNWFKQLLADVHDAENTPAETRYWDQSIASLAKLIENAKQLDEVKKKCYQQRLEHYVYLSTFKPAAKSDLYPVVQKLLMKVGHKLGGDLIDAARKELEMWEIPFREPSETDTEEVLKARKDEIEKIKAEWLKKAKKKKWGEEEENALLKDYKDKLKLKTLDELKKTFDGFDKEASAIELKKTLSKVDSFNFKDYFTLLSKMKTVRETDLAGKKVLIKLGLKLRDGAEEKLKELKVYLQKKKEEALRREDEMKNQQANKKKKQTKGKKKSDEEEQKPLFFDFNSLLEPQNWNGFAATLKAVLEKQPFMVLIGFSYGPALGMEHQDYSLQFLLEPLRSLETSVEFLPHQEFLNLRSKIEAQTISEGSIYLLENLNFLPMEVMQQNAPSPTVHQQNPSSKQIKTEAEPKVQKPTAKGKLLYPQIRDHLEEIAPAIDTIVTQDCYIRQQSGLIAYLHKPNVLGTLWWKYLGLAARTPQASIVLGGPLEMENISTICKVLKFANKLLLTSEVGLKFWMASNNVKKFANITIHDNDFNTLTEVLQYIKTHNLSHNLILPTDFLLGKIDRQANQSVAPTEIKIFSIQNDSNEFGEDWTALDIGPKSVAAIESISNGHLFIVGPTDIPVVDVNTQNINVHSKQSINQQSSMCQVLRYLYRSCEARKLRHQAQSSTPDGIDYTMDLVIYLVGVPPEIVNKVNFKTKKPPKAIQVNKDQENGEGIEQQEQEVQEEVEPDDDQPQDKTELVSDFSLQSSSCFMHWLDFRPQASLKHISNYA